MLGTALKAVLVSGNKKLGLPGRFILWREKLLERAGLLGHFSPTLDCKGVVAMTVSPKKGNNEAVLRPLGFEHVRFTPLTHCGLTTCALYAYGVDSRWTTKKCRKVPWAANRVARSMIHGHETA